MANVEAVGWANRSECSQSPRKPGIARLRPCGNVLRSSMLRLSSIILLAGRLIAFAAAPPEYYAAAEGKAGNELKAALYTIIRNHHVIRYTGGTFNTRDALNVLDQSPTNASMVVLVYNGSNMPVADFGIATGWNREHLWPQSYGLDGVEPSYSDLFNLRACDANVNSSRGNKYFDTTTTNGPGYSFPAHTEAPLCSTDLDSWEPPPVERGDIARIMFYMATRYRGDVPDEPLLELTDDSSLITSTNAYMGKLNTFLAWHTADPVDDTERLRNDRIYSLYQTNRNPYVDHPEWVNLTFAPPHTNRPPLAVSLHSQGIVLSWLATNQVTRLEYTTNLSAGWMTVTNVPLLTNSQFCVTWTNELPRAFFRLRLP
jgi:endonuclease I